MIEATGKWLYDGDCIHCSACKSVFDISNDEVNFGTTLLRFSLRYPKCMILMNDILHKNKLFYLRSHEYRLLDKSLIILLLMFYC